MITQEEAEMAVAELKAGVPMDTVRAKYSPELHQRIMEERGFQQSATPTVCLYVIPAGEYIKIGISANVESRWKGLKTSNPELERPIFVSAPLHDARGIELQVHAKLQRYRVSGTEWFKCHRSLVLEVVHALVEGTRT